MLLVNLLVLLFDLLLDSFSFLLSSLNDGPQGQPLRLESLVILFHFLQDLLLELRVQLIVTALVIVYASVSYDHNLLPQK